MADVASDEADAVDLGRGSDQGVGDSSSATVTTEVDGFVSMRWTNSSAAVRLRRQSMRTQVSSRTPLIQP